MECAAPAVAAMSFSAEEVYQNDANHIVKILVLPILYVFLGPFWT
jgi:hypothetical protein